MVSLSQLDYRSYLMPDAISDCLALPKLYTKSYYHMTNIIQRQCNPYTGRYSGRLVANYD